MNVNALDYLYSKIMIMKVATQAGESLKDNEINPNTFMLLVFD